LHWESANNLGLNASTLSAPQALFGLGQNNSLQSGSGNDLLVSRLQAGSQVQLTGGAGADQFRWFSDNPLAVSGSVQINDFKVREQDRLDLDALLAPLNPNKTLDHYLQLSTIGEDAVLRFDWTGAASFDGSSFQIILDNAVNQGFAYTDLQAMLNDRVLLV
jgi:Ca2+-binding RTX toxin-like protein